MRQAVRRAPPSSRVFGAGGAGPTSAVVIGRTEVDGDRPGVPDLARVFGDGAVAGEAAHAGQVGDDPSGPLALVAVDLPDPRLARRVRLVVGADHVRVAMPEIVDHRGEAGGIAGRQETGGEE